MKQSGFLSLITFNALYTTAVRAVALSAIALFFVACTINDRDVQANHANIDTQRTIIDPCASDLESAQPRLAEKRQAIYGGELPLENDPVVGSTLALFTKSDLEEDITLIDGSATLIAPTVALGAAHTCTLFNPQFASLGIHPPTENEQLFEEQANANHHGRVVRIHHCDVHPDFEKGASRPNDIALFYLSHTPHGAVIASVLDPVSPLPEAITIAGFGAHQGQFDRWWEEIEPYSLKRVDSFISAEYTDRGLFKDGPNEGKGSCQGDSGGPIFVRVQSYGSFEEQTDEAHEVEQGDQSEIGINQAILVGSVVMGPECDQGVGYNTDLRQYVSWINDQLDGALQLQSWQDRKSDHMKVISTCH